MDIISVYRIIDLTGVFINGILGGAIARRRKFDAIGFGLLAILSGLGGGLLRDTLLQNGPRRVKRADLPRRRIIGRTRRHDSVARARTMEQAPQNR